MITLMIAIGGLTRLTESGLSMVNWHPVHGTIPPLNLEQWQEEFNAYKQSPEYQKINRGMTLEEFKNIFALEYIHRLLGRITGLVFLIPLIYFIIKKQVTKRLTYKLIAVFLLGGLQAVIGWYMVKSGLYDTPKVSPYRLALHLTTAFIIFTILWITALSLQTPKAKKNKPHPHASLAILVASLILAQTIIGAFVAGLDAGLIYNTFPTMNGQWIPEDVLAMKPLLRNITENPATVQFIHRLMAFITAIAILYYLFISYSHYQTSKTQQKSMQLLLILTCIQITLGVTTLIHQVPTLLASLHQMGALFLYANALFLSYSMVYSNDPTNRNTT